MSDSAFYWNSMISQMNRAAGRVLPRSGAHRVKDMLATTEHNLDSLERTVDLIAQTSILFVDPARLTDLANEMHWIRLTHQLAYMADKSLPKGSQKVIQMLARTEHNFDSLDRTIDKIHTTYETIPFFGDLTQLRRLGVLAGEMRRVVEAERFRKQSSK